MAARSTLVMALALTLAACATHAPQPQEPLTGGRTFPAPSGPAPAQTHARCTAGIGEVVRIVDLGASASAAASPQGGVLAGVLGQDAAPNHHGSGHDLYLKMDDGRRLIANQQRIDGIAVGNRVMIDADCRAHALH